MEFVTNEYSVVTDDKPHILCPGGKNSDAEVKNIYHKIAALRHGSENSSHCLPHILISSRPR